jgi:thiol:disulfide interchange protein
MIQRFFSVVCLLLTTGLLAHAQILKPAKMYAEPITKSVKVGEVVDVVFKADIDQNWYIYSLGFDPDCGPLPTSFTFTPHSSYQLVGEPKAIQDKAKHDEIFDCDVRVFVKNATFIQKIKILSATPSIAGTFEGQVCSEVDGKCVLFEGDFDVSDVKVETSAVATTTPTATPSTNVASPTNETPTTSSNPVAEIQEPVKTIAKHEAVKGPMLDETLVSSSASQQSFFGFFLLAFLAGLAALLTPCVFPMIPMTVSFFTNGKKRSLAFIFGLSIIAIYTIIGAAIAPLMGPETANHLSTEWLPNIIFFLVFMLFGFSFLGLFDITLPGQFINSVDKQAEKGGLVGVFFMAFTLVLVSFSCTGPLVGSILVSSAGGEFLKPIVGMFAFSLAFAIPFTLFAIFPGWLNSLPKSGGWLNSVKVVLGFIEIALAFKFLSIADQAFHWGILDRDINIAIWIVIVTLIGLYLMKAFRLPGDTGKDVEDKRVSILRLTLAMIAFTFVVYLIPGLWGAPLKALAGYLPPMHTHDFNVLAKDSDKAETLCEEPLYADFLHLPHGIQGYYDYAQAIRCAREQNKPVFIDFTGHGCTNCREMEAVVWEDPQVLSRLKNDFVVVALYVDDKTELPEEKWYTSTYDNKIKKTIGKQNADLQIKNLNNNAQPFYVIVGLDERVLVNPFGYDKDVEKFVKFLEEGKSTFKKLYTQP